MSDSGLVCKKLPTSDEVSGTSSEQMNSSPDGITSNDLPRPKANTIPSAVVLPIMKQTEYEDNNKEKQQMSKVTYCDEENCTKISVNEIKNNREDYSSFANKLETLDRPKSTENENNFMQTQVRPSGSQQKKENTNENFMQTQVCPSESQQKKESTNENFMQTQVRPSGSQQKNENTNENFMQTQVRPSGSQQKNENTNENFMQTQIPPFKSQQKKENTKENFMQTQVRPSESQQKKESTNESLELPNQVLKNKENSIFSPNQTLSSISEKNTEEKTFVQNSKNQNSFIKDSTLDDEFNRNKNEAVPNANKQNTPKIKQLESSQKSPNSTESRTKPDNIKAMVKAPEVCSQNNLSKTDSLCLPLALVSGHFIKDRQGVNVCSPGEDQSQSLDQSNGKPLPKNNQTVKSNEESRIDPSDKNFQILGKNDGINSERNPRHLEMTTFHSNDDQMKSPFLRPSPKVPNVTRTPSKQNSLEESLISSQFVTEPNRKKEFYIQRPMKGSNQSFTGPPICPYNSEPDMPPNKYANDYISTNNFTNQYNNNQTYINTNQEPLNLIDTNSKFLSNAISVPNVQRAPLPNQPQQFSLSNPRLQSMPNVNKDTFKSEYVPSAVPDSSMNSVLLHNQSFYAQYSAPSLHYNTMYPHNSALRRSAVGNQPVTPNNNAVLPVQQPGYYSSQSVQRHANIPGSSSVMWTQNRDQKISTDTSSFSENYGNLGIGSSFNKLPKTLFSNSSRNNYYSSIPVSVKDPKLQQNVETRTTPNVDWNRGHSPFPQPFPGCYNQMKQTSVPSNPNNFPYRNDYSFQSAPNYFKRGPYSGNAADPQDLNQNQNLAMQFQRSYQEKYQETNHYHPSFQMPSYGSLRDTLHVPTNPICTPPLLRAQGVASFNLQNRYDQPGPKSINSTVNPPKLGNPNVVNTYVTTINSAPIFWSAKDFQQNKDPSTKELSPLINTDQLSAYQFSQNKNLEFNRYQTNTTNMSKTKPIISSLEPTTTHPIYNKDSGLSATNTAQTVCSSTNSGSILTWSHAHPPTFDPNRPLHVTHDGYANYNPQTIEGQSGQKYIPQQETIKFHQNSPQTLNNNYFKAVVSSFDSYQGSQIQQNISSSNSNNYISTYNSNASAQNLESHQVENQTSTIIKKLPSNSETGISPSNGQNTWKAQLQDKSNGCFIQSETRITKLSTSSQLENGYVGKDLDQKALEGKSDEQCFPKAPPTAMSDDSSFKTSDVLRNLAMTSDESFLFSDLDPLFTSSLLTNDLAYFPETNSAFDQCFEDAASIIMNTVNTNEVETVENVNHINRVEHSKNAPQLQPQPTIFSNTSDNNINNDYNNDNNYNNINDNDNNNTIPKSVPMLPFLQKQSHQINTTSGTDPNELANSHSPIRGQSQYVLFDGSNESIQTEVTQLNISSSSSVIGPCAKTVYSGVNPKDSPESTFSGMWASKMAASELVKGIADPRKGNEWNPQKGQVQRKKESGMGINKKNQEKKVQPTSEEESSKWISKKTRVIKSAPRPRGRPPKNRSSINPNLIPSQTLTPGISISSTNTANHTKPLDIHSKTSRDDHLTEIPKQNSQVNLPDYSNVSRSNRENKCTEFESLTSKAKSKNKNLSTKGFLAQKEHKTKLVSNRQTQCEMSELELIDVLTKRFDSISNIEEKESSGKIKNHTSSPIPESLDRSKDSSIKDSTCEADAVSVEERAVSREKTLLKAYLKLKKKLDKRIKQSLRRQHHLRRNELKINKGLWKSKAEIKTGSPDSSADFKAEHLSRSYFNRSPLSADDNKLIVTADSTGIDADLDKRHGSEKAETFEIETVVNRKEPQDQSSITNDIFETPTKVTETKDGVSRTETSLLSTLPIKEMKTCLKEGLQQHLDPIQQDSLFDQESKDKTESADLIKGETTDCSKSVGESQNINTEINSKELLQVENSSKEDNRGNQETDILPSVSQTKIKPPITQPCSPKTSPSTSPPRSAHKTLPEPILQFRVETEEVTPRKVGPTIVENAKICFQSINCYLEKDGSNFDSFLMNYANIVHGLLNCGAERYNRIKAVLLNTPNERSNNCNIENKGKSIILSNSNVQEVDCKDSLILQRDIDASDVEGDFEKGENTIDMDDFSCSYADIVKEILSSRGDEYCNIKKAINRNICWNMVDAYEEPMKSLENRSSHEEEEKSAISALPVLSNSDETLNELLNEKSLQLKNLGPDSVIIKRRKRKSPKEKGYIRGKNGITEMGIGGTPNRKRKPKKEKNSSIQIELWKGNTSISETKTSVSKTTMDNSDFVAQNTKPSNAKTKYPNLPSEHYPEDYDSKCPLSSDENFVEESTGDYVIGLGSESGSDERYTATPYIKPANPVINPSSKDQASNFSHLKLNIESDQDFQGVDKKTRTLDSGFGNMFSITTLEQNFKAKIPKASGKLTATNVDYVKCPCGCSDDEEDTRDDSIDSKLRDLTTSFKTRNRSKIIKPKSASVSKKCGQLRKLNKNQEKISSKILNDVHHSEKNALVNDDHGKFFKDSKMNSDPKMLKNFENKFPKCSTNNFPVNNEIIRSFTALKDLDPKLTKNSVREDLCDFGEETGGGSRFSDDCWKPEKTLKNTKQKLLQTKKNKTRGILSNYSLFSKNNTKVGYLDEDNFHRELATVKKDKEENVSTLETKPTKKTAIKELNHNNNNSLKISPPSKDFNSNIQSSFTSENKYTKKDEETENFKLPSLDSIYDTNNNITSSNNVDKNNTSQILLEDYNGTPNTKQKLIFSDDNVNSSAEVDEASEVDECVPYSAGNSKSRSKAKDETNSMSTLNAHSFDMTRKENIEDEFDNVEEGPHSCEKRLRSLIENITEISRATKRLDKEHPASVRNSPENPTDASKIDLIPPEDKTRNTEETKVKTEIMETIDETIHCPIALAKYEDSSSDGCLSSDEGNKKLSSFDKSLDRTYEVKLPSPLNKPKKKYKPTLKIKSIGIDNKIIIRKSYHKNTKKHGQDLTREDKNIFNIIGENITKEDKTKKTYIQQDSNKESLILASPSISGKSKKSVSSSGSHKSKTDRYSDEQTKPIQTISKKSVPKSETQISNTNLEHSKVFTQKREQLCSPHTPENLKFPASSETLKAKKEDIFEKPSNYSNMRENSTVALLNIQTDGNVALNKKATHDSKHIKSSPCLKVTAPSSCSTLKAKKEDIFEKPSNYSNVREDSTVALLSIQTDGNVALNKKATHDSKHTKSSPCLKVTAPSSSSKDKKRKKTTEDENIGNSLAGIKDGIKERLIVGGDPNCSKTSTLNGLPSEQIQDEHLKPGGSLDKDNDNELARKPKRIRRSGKDRPNLQCTFCLKFFKSASELLFHTRYHTGDRPFVCDQCSKAFVSKSHLTRHQRTHSTERRYVCPTCDRAFTTHYSMLIHELIHSGLKPHTCGDCSKAFRTKGYLNRHIKKYHQVESGNP